MQASTLLAYAFVLYTVPMIKHQNTFVMLGLSLALGPVMTIYWAYEYFRGLFIEPGFHKGIRAMGVAEIGAMLSLTSTVLWFVIISTIL